MNNETPVKRFVAYPKARFSMGMKMYENPDNFVVVVSAEDYDKLKTLYDELRWRMDGLEK